MKLEWKTGYRTFPKDFCYKDGTVARRGCGVLRGFSFLCMEDHCYCSNFVY